MKGGEMAVFGSTWVGRTFGIPEQAIKKRIVMNSLI